MVIYKLLYNFLTRHCCWRRFYYGELTHLSIIILLLCRSNEIHKLLKKLKVFFDRHSNLSNIILSVRATLFKSSTSGCGAALFLAGLQPRRKAIRFHNTYRQTTAWPLLLRGPLLLHTTFEFYNFGNDAKNLTETLFIALKLKHVTW